MILDHAHKAKIRYNLETIVPTRFRNLPSIAVDLDLISTQSKSMCADSHLPIYVLSVLRGIQSQKLEIPNES